MDLKPANILFNSKMNPVIIDFGLSVVLDGDDDEITWNSVAGTM
jgi:serine/threonine protein kinase